MTGVQTCALPICFPVTISLVDGGAEQFYKVTRDIIEKSPDTKVEILIPDFKGNDESLKRVIESGATIIGHNVETVPSLYRIRRNGTFKEVFEVEIFEDSLNEEEKNILEKIEEEK